VIKWKKANFLFFSPANLEAYLGSRKFKKEEANRKNQIGRVNGLAWTPVGGTIIKVEVALMPGKGKLVCTGQLGVVMEQSVKIAFSYARAHADKFNIDSLKFENKDFHIHFPAGAVPKDGPSAGITTLTALISALTGRAVNCNYAMTGEINLSGDVLEIGRLKDKILAAKQSGITQVIIPSENKSDLADLEDVTKDIEIILVEHVDEVLERVLLSNQEQHYPYSLFSVGFY